MIEKDLVDEIIFGTSGPKNRLRLEFMAWGGMRTSEVIEPTPSDAYDRRLTPMDPKSGKEQEFKFIRRKPAGVG